MEIASIFLMTICPDTFQRQKIYKFVQFCLLQKKQPKPKLFKTTLYCFLAADIFCLLLSFFGKLLLAPTNLLIRSIPPFHYKAIISAKIPSTCDLVFCCFAQSLSFPIIIGRYSNTEKIDIKTFRNKWNHIIGL